MAIGDHWSVAGKYYGVVSYRHHFIELWPGKVIHWYGDGPLKALATIRIDDEETVTGGRPKVLHSSGGLQAALRAIGRLGESGYNLLWDNCEHFATWATTGLHWSPQVTAGCVGAGIGLVGGYALASGFGLGLGASVLLPVAAAAGCAFLAVMAWNWLVDRNRSRVGIAGLALAV